MSACRKCHAGIIWATTTKGASIPIDEEPVQDGNLVLVPQQGRTVLARTPDELLDRGRHRYVSHFATCPNAAEFRR